MYKNYGWHLVQLRGSGIYLCMRLLDLLAQASPLHYQCFYAYAGCDTVSSFSTKGKKTVWFTRMNYEEVTPTFLALSAGLAHINDDDIGALEWFIILLYDHTSSINNVDQDRQEFFMKKGRAMDDDIPPTKAALVQHIKRTVYQEGHC